jgi:hypothetical protein
MPVSVAPLSGRKKAFRTHERTEILFLLCPNTKGPLPRGKIKLAHVNIFFGHTPFFFFMVCVKTYYNLKDSDKKSTF